MTTTTGLPVHSPRALAEALRESDLPGQRSMTAIEKLRRERRKIAEARRDPRVTVEQRLRWQLADRYSAEIARRGGETDIRRNKNRYDGLAVADRRNGLVLLHVSGWRYYSASTTPRRAALSYLCGHEDGHDWAVRVPGTITTVTGALEWITPAEVRRAEAAGRRVRRQGDVYAIETTRAHDGSGDLPDRHSWNRATRYLTHPQHRPVELPWPVRFVLQNSYGMGRGAARGCGDV